MPLRSPRPGPPRRPADRPRVPGARAATVVVAAVLALAPVACGAPTAPTVGPISVDPAATAPVATAPARAAAPSCLDTALAQLGDRRYGQLVMGGLPAGAPSAAGLAAVRAGSGGVVLVDGPSASVATVRSTVEAAQQAATAGGGPPLLVSTDQEGGQVQKLAGPGFGDIPAPTQQPQAPAALQAAWARWAQPLTQAGLTLDLAPVADVVDPNLLTRNAPVGQYGREYGTEAVGTGSRVAAVVSGLDSAGVASTLKHFPGLGKVTENTDFAGGVVDATTGPDDPDLQSFGDGIRAGAPAVMMSSARYPAIDRVNAALFSPTVINDVLRGKLGFTGVVMTDDVGVAVALAGIPVGQRATRFVAAGGDLVLTVKPTDVPTMIDALTVKAAGDPAFRARADDAVRHVLALKARQKLICR